MALTIGPTHAAISLPPDAPKVRFTFLQGGVQVYLIKAIGHNDALQEEIDLSRIFFLAFDRQETNKELYIRASDVPRPSLIENLRRGLIYKTDCTVVQEYGEEDAIAHLILNIDVDKKCLD